MTVYETIYEKGCLKLVGRPKIDADVIKVKIVNRDSILTDEDIEDLLDALKEKSEGKLKLSNIVFS